MEFINFKKTSYMIKKRPKLDLQELVHNKIKFGKLPTLLQKKIFEFFRDSKNLNRKIQKIEGLKKKIKDEQPLKRKLSKDITENFNYISNELSLGIPSIYLTPEFTGKSYRIDIDWKGKRKKFTIGKTISDVKNLCEKYKPKSSEGISSTNFKEIIKKSLTGIIEKEITKIGRDKFEMLHKIELDKNTLEIKLIHQKNIIGKGTGKPTKKPSSIIPNSQLTKNSGGGLVKNTTPFGKPSTNYDTTVFVNDIKGKRINLPPMGRKKK
jgi:hypothetical protein